MPPNEDRPPWSPDGPPRGAHGAFGLWGVPGRAMYRLALPRWQLPVLRIAVVSDLHACTPWVSCARVAAIVARVNTLGADLILLGGDYLADRYLPARGLPADKIVPILAPLRAPLGVFAAMGNHDWKDCARSRATGGRENSVIDAFAASEIPLVRNGAVHLRHEGADVWLAVTDSGAPHLPGGAKFDRARAFAGIPQGACVIHLAHEPDCFADGDARPVIQISGHTHGGQGVIFGRRPMTPSRFGDRYALGHVRDGDRHLIVSAGIGYTGLPMRFRVPPEITLIELRQGQDGGGPPHDRHRDS